MNNRKVVLLMNVILLFTLGCKQTSTNNSKGIQKDVFRIGILQDKPQEWADALKLGFSDGLIEANYNLGDDVVLINRSATGDPLSLSTIAQSFIRDEKINLVYTLGTQSSQEVFNLSKEKCIIFGAVTDPIKAGFYDVNLTTPKGNITGTQDLWPYPAQFQLIKELLPNIQSIGTIYNIGEINSQVSINYIKSECKKHGIKLIERSVASDQEVELAVSGILNQGIDLFFIPADNTAQAAAPVIIGICNNKKIPVFTGISGIVEQGAIATVGTNYYELGKVNAKQAIEIFKGESCSSVPVSIADKGDLYINEAAFKKCGLNLTETLKNKAIKIY